MTFSTAAVGGWKGISGAKHRVTGEIYEKRTKFTLHSGSGLPRLYITRVKRVTMAKRFYDGDALRSKSPPAAPIVSTCVLTVSSARCVLIECGG